MYNVLSVFRCYLWQTVSVPVGWFVKDDVSRQVHDELSMKWSTWSYLVGFGSRRPAAQCWEPSIAKRPAWVSLAVSLVCMVHHVVHASVLYTTAVCWTPPIWRRRVLQMLLFSNRFRQHLNGSLRNFNTWHVLVGNGTLQGDFLGIVPKTFGPQNYLFSTTSQLSGNFEGQYLWWEQDTDNREMALETMKGPLHHPQNPWTLLHH